MPKPTGKQWGNNWGQKSRERKRKLLERTEKVRLLLKDLPFQEVSFWVQPQGILRKPRTSTFTVHIEPTVFISLSNRYDGNIKDVYNVRTADKPRQWSKYTYLQLQDYVQNLKPEERYI